MMKTLLKVFAGIFVLLVIALVGFVYTFDANTYKEEITSVAEAITERSINIEGDMDISLYPWIGIKIHDVTIGNSEGFNEKNFASIGQLDVRVKIVPLLQQRLVIDKLVLHKLAIDFEKNLAGEDNLPDIAGRSENEGVASSFGFSDLAIGGIEITDSRLTWLDKNTGKRFKVSKLNLTTKAISKGQALPVDIKAYVQSNQPSWQAAIKATTKLDFNAGKAVLNANKLTLAVKALLPLQQMDTVSFALAADTTVDLRSQTARLENTKISALGLKMSGVFDIKNLFSVPFIQGPLKVDTFDADTLAKHFNVDFPQLSNTQSLKKISLTTEFKTDFKTVYFDDISAEVDDSHIDGFVRISTAPQAAVHYKLKADKLNVGDYRVVSNKPEKVQEPLQLDFIRAVDLDGVFEVESVTLDENELEKFYLASKIKNGIVDANPITMRVNTGEVKAALRLDARETPAVLLTAKATNLDAAKSIDPLLEIILGDDVVTMRGLVNADVNLSAKGSDMKALTASAKGKITLNMDKVVVKGVDFDHASQSVVVDYAKRNDFRVSRTFNAEYILGKETEFTGLSATFNVLNGKLINKNLLLVSNKLDVSGQGQLDFIDGKLDYRPVIDMKVKNTVNIRDKLRDNPMQYHTHGSLGELSYDFDADRYDLHMGRLMLQEAKAHKNRQLNSQSQNNWKNVLSQ